MAFLKYIFILLCGTLLAPCSARAVTAAMQDVKFAFIGKFAYYVGWPPQSFESESSPLRICIAGNSGVSEAFKSYSTKIAYSRQIQAVWITGAAEADSCHILFVSDGADAALTRKIIKAVEKSPVLTVGDSPDFLEQGGIIRFDVAEKRVSFAINATAAKRNALAISAKLLSLARKAP